MPGRERHGARIDGIARAVSGDAGLAHAGAAGRRTPLPTAGM
jgi:hypothetical protein